MKNCEKKRTMPVISALLIAGILAGTASASSGGFSGYTFKDSTEHGGPTYDWIEISGTGVEVFQDFDDDWVENIDLGFSFNYYGRDYSQLGISSNGMLFPGAGTWEYVNRPITQTPDVSGMIVPFWDDLQTSGGKIYYQTLGTAPNRMFVVEWYDNQHYSRSDNGVTFEAILHEGSNNIKFQYKNVDFGNVYDADDAGGDEPPYNNGGSATVGIEGNDGNAGLQYSFNEAVINPGLAILFEFQAQPTSPVPEMPTIALVFSGVAGLMFLRRKP